MLIFDTQRRFNVHLMLMDVMNVRWTLKQLLVDDGLIIIFAIQTSSSPLKERKCQNEWQRFRGHYIDEYRKLLLLLLYCYYYN